MTLERPMFPPRAESVDSFSARPASRKPLSENRTSDARKPAKGIFGGSIKPWTQEETALARRMLAAGKPDSEFHRVFGRSKLKARLRLWRLARPTQGYDWLGLPMQERIDVPAEAWADASRRLNAPRTLSAWICGDPAPGYSALDKRMGGAHVG